MIPTEGITYLLNTGYKAGSQIPDWYVALFEGNYTPVAGSAAANFVANATECTTYAETTRPIWNEGAITAGALDNSASKAEFTFNAAKTVYGAALLSVSTKGASTGTMGAIARFASARAMQIDDILRVTVPVAMTSV